VAMAFVIVCYCLRSSLRSSGNKTLLFVALCPAPQSKVQGQILGAIN